jgi:hypothetical protein
MYMEVSVRERGEAGKYGRLGWRERRSAVLEDFVAECGKVHRSHDGMYAVTRDSSIERAFNGRLLADSRQTHAVVRSSADVLWRVRDEVFRRRSRIDVEGQCIYHIADLGWEA